VFSKQQKCFKKQAKKINLMKESKHLEHSCNKVFPLQITPGIKWKKEANSSH